MIILEDVTNPYTLALNIQGKLLCEKIKPQKNILYNIHVKNIYKLKHVFNISISNCIITGCLQTF